MYRVTPNRPEPYLHRERAPAAFVHALLQRVRGHPRLASPWFDVRKGHIRERPPTLNLLWPALRGALVGQYGGGVFPGPVGRLWRKLNRGQLIMTGYGNRQAGLGGPLATRPSPHYLYAHHQMAAPKPATIRTAAQLNLFLRGHSHFDPLNYFLPSSKAPERVKRSF